MTEVSTTAGMVAKLGRNSLVYAVGTVFSRGVGFLLVPVFTQAMTPADYGILAVTATVSGLLIMILGLSMESAVAQMYIGESDADEQRSLYGSLLVFWVVVSGLLTLGLHLLGCAGALGFFRDVPYRPYLELALWSAYLSVFVSLPTMIYATRQQPLHAAGLSTGSALATVLLSIYFVLFLRQGVVGCLRATLISSALTASVSIGLTIRMSSSRISWSKLKRAMRFSLPLVPHMASQWGLNLSDRFVLERYVSSAQIGVYSLGYQFGQLVSLAAVSMNSAFFPIANNCLSKEESRDRLPRIGTYAFAAVAAIGLVVSVFGGDVIRAVTPAKYHRATTVVPWIALAYVFQAAYLVLSRGTWYCMKTGWVPFVTAFATMSNNCLNLWLAPRFGIMAAAINTTAAYALLALLHGLLAHWLFPIQWQYWRCAKLVLVGAGCYVLGLVIPHCGGALATLAKAAIVFVLCPVLLAAVGFFERAEISLIFSALRRTDRAKHSSSGQ